jgi:hypothetical protein
VAVFVLPLTIPLVGVGFWMAWRRPQRPRQDVRTRRNLVIVLAAWCLVTAAALGLQLLLHDPLPGHRILAFCLPAPMLCLIAGLGARDRLQTSAKIVRALPLLVIVALLAGIGSWRWLTFQPAMNATLLGSAARVGEFLRAVPEEPGRSIVIVYDPLPPTGTRLTSPTALQDGQVWLVANELRTEIPTSLVPATYLFPGSPDDFLRGAATSLAPGALPGDEAAAARFELMSITYLRAIPASVRSDSMVILVARDPAVASGWAHDHAAQTLGPGAALVRPSGADESEHLGLLPSATHSRRSPFTPPDTAHQVALAAGLVCLLAIAGSGWAVALSCATGQPTHAAGLTLAAGIGVVLLAGVLSNRIGLPMSAIGGGVLVVVVGLVGWVVAMRTRAGQGPHRREASGSSDRLAVADADREVALGPCQ